MHGTARAAYKSGMDFSPDDLFEAVDRVVADLLPRAGVAGPPVDALHVAEAAFKAVGRALRAAVRAEGTGVPSTKGIL